MLSGAPPSSVPSTRRCRFASMATVWARESEQVDAANSSGRTPVVFIHGLWLLASSWDRWAALFEQAGFAPVAPGCAHDRRRLARGRRQGARVRPALRLTRRASPLTDSN